MILFNLDLIYKMIQFILNDELISTDCAPEETLLDFIRYHRHLKGTKIGCREGDCGACTVMTGVLRSGKVQYDTVTSCLMPMGNVRNKHIVTIEGINTKDHELTPVQTCVAEQNGSQCGFCTPGFIMSLTCFAISDEEKSSKNAIKSMDGNICRCTGYKSLERAADQLANYININNRNSPNGSYPQEIAPQYFSSIADRLEQLVRDQINVPPERNLVPVAGGTDLYVHHRHHLLKTKAGFPMQSGILNEIAEKEDYIVMDGSTTVTQFSKSTVIRSLFPDLDKHIKLVSSTPIRNMATLAGNFINASPIGDMTIFFLALEAEILLENAGNDWIPLKELYLGYKTLKKEKNEALLSIRFKKPLINSKFNFEKVSKRMHLDIATVTTACVLTYENEKISNAVISMGGVGPIPMCLTKTASFLIGYSLPLKEEEYNGLSQVLQSEIKPISDIRGSEKYKRLLAAQLLKAHLIEIQKKYAQH